MGVCASASRKTRSPSKQAVLIGAARWHHVDAHCTEPAGCKWPVTNDRGGPAWPGRPHVLSRDVHDHALSQWRCPITAGWIAEQRIQSSITNTGRCTPLSLARQQQHPYHSFPATVWVLICPYYRCRRVSCMRRMNGSCKRAWTGLPTFPPTRHQHPICPSACALGASQVVALGGILGPDGPHVPTRSSDVQGTRHPPSPFADGPVQGQKGVDGQCHA